MRAIIIKCIVIWIVAISCGSQKPMIPESVNFESKLLELEIIQNYLEKYNPFIAIRIIDLTNSLVPGKKSIGTHIIYVEKKLKLNYNTGKYLDIVLVDVNKIDADRLKFEVFFSPPGKYISNPNILITGSVNLRFYKNALEDIKVTYPQF